MPPFDPDAAARPDSGVFGLSTPESEARVVLVPVPFDATTSYRRGAAGGPAAIFNASKQVDLFDREVGRPYRAGIFMRPESHELVGWNEQARAAADPIIEVAGVVDGNPALLASLARVNALSERVNDWVYRETRALLEAGKLVGIVGGDHAVPYGAIRALAERRPGLGILHIDAHADLREAFEGFTYSHASIMHNVMTRLPGVAKLVQVGIRDLGEQEDTFILESTGRIECHFDVDIARARFEGEPFRAVVSRILAPLPAEVYVSFDIDGLDPALCPGTGTPVPGGLSFHEASFLLGALASSGRRIVGFDLNEVAPGGDGEWDGNVGARMLYKLIGWALRSEQPPPPRLSRLFDSGSITRAGAAPGPSRQQGTRFYRPRRAGRYLLVEPLPHLLAHVATLDLVILSLLSLYGLHRAQLLALYLLHRGDPVLRGGRLASLPTMTVQVPMYNEPRVAARVLEAIARLRYPRDKLDIQVLDDSTDETVGIVDAKLGELAARGFRAAHLRRGSRRGFKAGALEHALGLARGELVLILDADFVPAPDLLERLLDHFVDPRVAMVQARHEHLNRDESLLTRTAGLLFDGHFVVEQIARSRSGRFSTFHGTGAVWRRAAIVDAGGWDGAMLAEDTDISFRAQLRSWRFVYVESALAPSELPHDVTSFRAQQFRWAKGVAQAARKLLAPLLSSAFPLRVKIEGFFHLTAVFSAPLVALLAALQLPSLFALPRSPGARAPVLLALLPLLALALFYGAAHRGAGGSRLGALARLPALLALSAGLSLSNARAAIEGGLGRSSAFVRTPKWGSGGGPPERASPGGDPFAGCAELGLGLYSLVALGAALARGALLSAPFHALFAWGFLWVGAATSRRAWTVHAAR